MDICGLSIFSYSNDVSLDKVVEAAARVLLKVAEQYTKWRSSFREFEEELERGVVVGVDDFISYAEDLERRLHLDLRFG